MKKAETIRKIAEEVRTSRRFLISAHENPEGDAIGSVLALQLALNGMGKEAKVLNQDPTPEALCFLPGAGEIIHRAPEGEGFDAAFALDCGDKPRLGVEFTRVQGVGKIINIDHHVTNDAFGSLRLVYPKASSTAEVLFELFTYTRARITRDMAILLYLGIMTDTGSFRYESTGPRTHAIVSELLKFKFSISVLYRKLYESVPMNDMKMFTKVVSHFDSLHLLF